MKFPPQQVVVITGAAQGIGKVMAQTFHSHQAKLALIDITEDKLTAGGHHANADTLLIGCDVSKSDQVKAAIAKIVGHYGRVDVLVNNAGILRDATLLKMEETAFDQVISVNLKGVFLMGQACAKIMAEQKSGKIINISSVAARGIFGQTNYSASKAGVIGMTKTWAKELSKYKINVNAIAPGLIETEMTASIPEQIRAQMISSIPLARMGQPLEIADLAVFLASPGAAYIQGEVVDINGGFLM